jgi:8-oxo-dGTP pyrophosphatase MutT (NUDIX family)
MKDIVKAMLLRGTNVLLARRSSGRRTYPDRWSFLETGEALDDALVRELQEEIGLTPLVFWKIGQIIEPNPSISGDVLYHMYAVNAWAGGEPSIVGDEHSEIRWFSIRAACSLQHLALAEYVPILRKLL